MSKASFIEQFRDNHEMFLDFIHLLSDADFLSSPNGKWTPGQQLEHIYLCLVPMAKVLPSKEFIRGKFGVIHRAVWSYDEVIRNYKTALAQGGKAPEKFVPQEVIVDRKVLLMQDTTYELDTIEQALEQYTEEDLDTLVLPHPLLGKLTIKEFFFMMGYHAIHHLEQTRINLAATQ